VEIFVATDMRDTTLYTKCVAWFYRAGK